MEQSLHFCHFRVIEYYFMIRFFLRRFRAILKHSKKEKKRYAGEVKWCQKISSLSDVYKDFDLLFKEKEDFAGDVSALRA